MNKWFAVVILFIASLSCRGQHFINGSNNFISIPNTKVYAVNVSLASESDVADFLNYQHKLISLPQYKIQNTSVRKSLTGFHYSYEVLKENIVVFGVQIQVHTANNGAILFVHDNVPNISEQAASNSYLADADVAWVMTNDGWEIASFVSLNDGFGTQSIQVDGDEIGTKSTKHFFQVSDTQVKAQVFLVNPLNTAEKSYGSPYIDSSDLDVPQLNAERKWVDMAVRYDNGSFSLKTNRYSFAQISNPVTQPTISVTDTFSFLRSQYQFEDVNAFYHVTNMSNYVEALGFESALPKSLIIDAHAYNGGDFSSFNYGVTPVELEFGEGGVDDAEDGEIVVHEFSHALAFFAGGDSYADTRDRSAMEEGNADYFSASYSKAYTDFAWDKMFNWDGHNPFFEGISIGKIMKYPQDMTGNSNADREMWSTPLMCIYDKIGRGPTDSLVLEHLYYQYKTATIPDMANILLTVDSLLFNKKYHHDIRNCFAENKILLSTKKDVSFSSLFTAYNTGGFSFGEGDAIIQAKQHRSFDFCVFDNLGQKLTQGQLVSSIALSPETYKSGIYFVELKTGGFTSYIKLMKY